MSKTKQLNTLLSRPLGYSLKRKALKRWIYKNGYTQYDIAKRMGVEIDEFKRRLREKDLFTREELWKLITLMKAQAAFWVIWIPDEDFWERVYLIVFKRTMPRKWRRKNKIRRKYEWKRQKKYKKRRNTRRYARRREP